MFGKQLDLASSFQLAEITKPARILVVGGGSGTILQHFTPEHIVDYVEPSSNMVAYAKSQPFDCTINFHQRTFQEFETNHKYDVFVFPFFLDMFNADDLEIIFRKVKNLINAEGQIIISDFTSEYSRLSVFQKLLLKSIFVFFRITSNHRLFEIINIQPLLYKIDFQLVKEKTFVSGMVVASVWKSSVH